MKEMNIVQYVNLNELFENDTLKNDVLKKLEDMKKILLKVEEQHISLHAKCDAEEKESKELENSTDSLTPVLRTALVINWTETAMKTRYKNFREKYPNITSLKDIFEVLNTKDAGTICKDYLIINSNKPENNPKYLRLKTLVEGFIEYQKVNNIENEIDALRHWADNFDIKNIRKDFISKRKCVGIGTVENIRLPIKIEVLAGE